jgi:hypothetical protein
MYNENKIKIHLDKQQAETEIMQLKNQLESQRLELEKLFELMNQRKVENEGLLKQVFIILKNLRI